MNKILIDHQISNKSDANQNLLLFLQFFKGWVGRQSIPGDRWTLSLKTSNTYREGGGHHCLGCALLGFAKLEPSTRAVPSVSVALKKVCWLCRQVARERAQDSAEPGLVMATPREGQCHLLHPMKSFQVSVQTPGM